MVDFEETHLWKVQIFHSRLDVTDWDEKHIGKLYLIYFFLITVQHSPSFQQTLLWTSQLNLLCQCYKLAQTQTTVVFLCRQTHTVIYFSHTLKLYPWEDSREGLENYEACFSGQDCHMLLCPAALCLCCSGFSSLSNTDKVYFSFSLIRYHRHLIIVLFVCPFSVLSCLHARTHARTHTRTHARTHTHTHTHTH